jgi:hypothetical protein
MNTVPAIPTLTGSPDRPSRHPKVARDIRDIAKAWRPDRIGGTSRSGPRARTPLVKATQQVRN